MSYLDRIRNRDGADKCRDELYRAGKRGAAALLNEPVLTFPCMFILIPQITPLRLYSFLNIRNKIALEIVGQILNPRSSGIDYLSVKNSAVYSVLKWMLSTSETEVNSDDFRQVLDIVVSVLINVYKDKRILPAAVKLMFKRDKAGYNIHNLVWALFRINDPIVLKLIAEHLRSSDPAETALACRLLNIKPDNQADKAAGCLKLYEDFIGWLEENERFLYFTGECLQATAEPVFCRVDLQKKNGQTDRNSEKEEMR